MATVEIRHFHLFCGLGGGALGFNQGETFAMGNTPIWVQPLVAGLMAAEGGL